MRTYSELRKLKTFEERFEYLKLNDKSVGEDTFGFDRYLNQKFYKSAEWKRLRNEVITRDLGCDLGIRGCEIQGPIYLHHMNPVKPGDIVLKRQEILDPEYLICVSFDTHNALHYGSINTASQYELIERRPNDTCPWKH